MHDQLRQLPTVHVYYCDEGWVLRYQRLAHRKVVNPEYGGYLRRLLSPQDQEKKWTDSPETPPEFVTVEGFELVSKFCKTPEEVMAALVEARRTIQRGYELGVIGFGILSYESSKGA